MYCPINQTSCYWQQPGSYSYQQAKTRCSSLGGYIASWNEADEQLQIENYFKVRVAHVLHELAGCMAGARWQAAAAGELVQTCMVVECVLNAIWYGALCCIVLG